MHSASESEVLLDDNGAELANPGMGWVLHYYDNVMEHYGSRLDAADTVEEFPGLTNLYLRLPWSAIEPQPGRFDWSVVDAPAQRWLDRGMHLSLRFSCCESAMDYATPQWVRALGAAGHCFETKTGLDPNGRYWEPDYNDPIFLDRLERFLEQAAIRYDGHPLVVYIDVGSFGVWGEGHTSWSTRLPYDGKTVIRHIDLYRKHFRKTLLMAIEPMCAHGRGIGVIDYADEQGLGYRTDSILVIPGDEIYHPQYAQRFWPRRPVTLECEHYGHSVDRGVWGDGSGFAEAVEHYHASWASIHWWPREFLDSCRELIRRINLRLGYRIQPVQASWPNTIIRSQPFILRSIWRNAGVAPLYAGGYAAFTLKQPNGGIVAILVDTTLNLRDLPIGNANDIPAMPLRSTLIIPPITPPGQYDLFVSVGDRLGTPTIAMPLSNDDGYRRYQIGSLTVQ